MFVCVCSIIIFLDFSWCDSGNSFLCDYLSMYLGNATGSRLYYTFAGSPDDLPLTLEPHGPQVLLKFNTDTTENYSGFNITYITGKHLIIMN